MSGQVVESYFDDPSFQVDHAIYQTSSYIQDLTNMWDKGGFEDNFITAKDEIMVAAARMASLAEVVSAVVYNKEKNDEH